MLALALGLGLTTIALATLVRRRGRRSADLGGMSDQWIAGYNASSRSSAD